jgi:hypothetical protein
LVIAATGGTIKAFPSTERAGRSYTASVIVVDEAAHHPYAAINYAAYKPAIDAGGQLIIVSTANGAGNWFHSMYVGARADSNGFRSRFYPWQVRPGRDAAWYQQQQREYQATPGLLAQEYPSQDDDAFLLSGNPRFAIESLLIHRERCRDPLPARGLKDLSALPGLRVWALPRPGIPSVLYSDPDEGLEGGDCSVSHVVAARTLDHVATLHGTWEPAVFAALSETLARAYTQALWGIERNNHGHAVLHGADKDLQTHACTGTSRSRRGSSARSTTPAASGWATHDPRE